MLPFFRGSIPDEVLLFDEVLQETYGPRVHWLQFPCEWTQMNHEIHGIEWGPSTSNNNNNNNNNNNTNSNTNKTFGDLKEWSLTPLLPKKPTPWGGYMLFMSSAFYTWDNLVNGLISLWLYFVLRGAEPRHQGKDFRGVRGAFRYWNPIVGVYVPKYQDSFI